MAPAEDKPPAMLSLEHPETGHCLVRAAGEIGSALRRIAAQNPRHRTATVHLVQDLQQRCPDSVDRGFDLLTVLIDARELLHGFRNHFAVAQRATASSLNANTP